jgi:hypothetical protein
VAINPMAWLLAIDRLHGSHLTHGGMAVLRALALAIAAGQDNPTHAQLARAARCSARNVRRVLAIARAAGPIDWAPVYRQTRQGPRREANRYWLRMPAEQIPARVRRPRQPGGQGVRARQEKISKQDEAAASVALLRARERFIAGQIAAQAAKYGGLAPRWCR